MPKFVIEVWQSRTYRTEILVESKSIVEAYNDWQTDNSIGKVLRDTHKETDDTGLIEVSRVEEYVRNHLDMIDEVLK